MKRVNWVVLMIACSVAAMGCSSRGNTAAAERSQLPPCPSGLIGAGMASATPERLGELKEDLQTLGWMGAGEEVVAIGLRPQLANAEEVRHALIENYPADLRDQGRGGSVRYYVLLNREGHVERVQIKNPSGHAAFNSAGAQVLSIMRFHPAVYESCRVPFWFEQTVTFEVQ